MKITARAQLSAYTFNIFEDEQSGTFDNFY
jgi:hypothetical protein